MSDLKMILADKSEILIDEFTVPAHAVVVCDTDEQVVAIWKRLTEENLVSVTVKYGDKDMLGYRYAGLTGVQCVENENGTKTAHFYIDGELVFGSEEDNAYITAAKILLGEEE